ncbi:MAG: hypothetical protein H0A75_07925 [Candidatus Methanofishera endochildressiae]|uniref:Uncharacterized protein n=1 Tax=Candidatus Methanofishera endochildressiae TaxID=2738884 RepID=A0A7Z0SDC3_9GAMM|nr:hypothetical protein [Candidatus Methanofishera endochildressiae]
MISEEEQKDLDKMMAEAKIGMARYKRGLYGGMAFNIDDGYKFMTVVNTCKNLGMDKVYWLDGDKISVELTLTEALKICATLMKSFGRSLAGEPTLMNIHLDAYKEHKNPVQQLKT